MKNLNHNTHRASATEGNIPKSTYGETGLNDKIVIIDDDHDDINMLSHFFAKMNEEQDLATFVSGETFLNVVRESHEAWDSQPELNVPRLIILDINMPQCSGLDVLKEIKSYQEWKTVPIILVTGTEDDQHIQKAYELGANAFISKPFDFFDLMQAIHRGFNFTSDLR